MEFFYAYRVITVIMEPEKSLIREFINGGWIIPFIGALTMFTRLISSPVKLTILEQLKKISAAAILSGVAWIIIDSGAVLQSSDIPSLYKAIIYGIIGVVSPEIINGIVSLAKKFEKNPEKFIKK
jgi:hypothetical protein